MMTEAQARTTANVVLATAVIGAVYYVLTTPPLRRKVWQAARSWAAGPVAVWTATEIRRAWDGSDPSAHLGPPAGHGATRPPSIRTASSASATRPTSALPNGARAAARQA